ncbi:hypothetical protein K3495_g8106 [Podosphaera aphanis]|nr:hypothetical protein K3495_g8106 [Podosphaera aphanis]
MQQVWSYGSRFESRIARHSKYSYGAPKRRAVKRVTPTENRLLKSFVIVHVEFSEVSSRHMYISAKVGNENLVALVDTGASGFAFVSTNLCDRLYLKFQALESPIAILGFEGKLSSRVTNSVNFPLILAYYGEVASAFVIPNSKHDLILGLPWLENTVHISIGRNTRSPSVSSV